jgi:hypothetical protein
VSTNVRCGLDFDATSDDYIVFQDANGNCEYDAGETIHKRTQFGEGFGYRSIVFDGDYGAGDGVDFLDGAVDNSFSFSPRGLPMPNGVVYLKNEKGEGRRIEVNIMGGVRLEKY